MQGASGGGGSRVGCMDIRQPTEGRTWVSIPAGHPDALLHSLHHKLNHALTLPLSLLRGRGEPVALPGQEEGCMVMWEESQPASASWRPAAQPAVSCSPLSATAGLPTYCAFCLLEAVIRWYGNKRAGVCWDSCCNTANIWK